MSQGIIKNLHIYFDNLSRLQKECSVNGVLFFALVQVCFDLFDTKKQEFLSGDDLGDIMRAMGFRHSQIETFNIEHHKHIIVLKCSEK